jgi:hypothetical protein
MACIFILHLNILFCNLNNTSSEELAQKKYIDAGDSRNSAYHGFICNKRRKVGHMSVLDAQ